MSKRAERRHHTSLKKVAARHYLTRITHWSCTMNGEPSARRIGMRARTQQACSCWGCGHRREHCGPTLQERRAAIRDDD